MPPKSRPAAKNPAARKPLPAHHKLAPSSPSRGGHAAAKGKISKETLKAHPKPSHGHAPAKTAAHHAAETKPQPKPTHRPAVESLSLIDKKHSPKKAEGETKKKTTVLPPISRIRESLGGTVAPPKPKA